MQTPQTTPRKDTEGDCYYKECARSPPPAPKIAPLNVALLQGSCDAVARVLDDDPMAAVVPIDDFQPPLVYAVKHGCAVPVLELLIEKGALLEAVGPARLTALEYVAGQEKVSCPWASFLGPALPPCSSLPLDLGCVDFMSPPGFDFPCPPIGSDAGRTTSILGVQARVNAAAEAHRINVVVLLLRHGANPVRAIDIAEQAGRTSCAALIRHWSGIEARQMLEAHWLQWDQELTDGQTPLGSGCYLLRMPPESRKRLCDFLAPATSQIFDG